MKRFRFIVIMTFLSIAGIAQDAQFSQFYSAPLYLGPSFAGSTGGGRIITNFRDQWPAIQSTYITYALSADYFISKYNSGIGLLLVRDQAGQGGLINSNNIGLLYSYDFDVSRKWRVRPGLAACFYNKGIDISKLEFGDQIYREGSSSVELGTLEIRPISHFDYTTSVLAYTERYWVGATIDHLMYISPILAATDEYLPLRYSAYGGAKYMIPGRIRKVREESVTLALNFMSQSKLNFLDLGVYYTIEPIIIGMWYRGIPVFTNYYNVGALAFSFGYKDKAWQIGYSYDFTLTRLITQTGGAHEVSASYTFKERKKRRIKHNMVPCPGF